MHGQPTANYRNNRDDYNGPTWALWMDVPSSLCSPSFQKRSKQRIGRANVYVRARFRCG